MKISKLKFYNMVTDKSSFALTIRLYDASYNLIPCGNILTNELLTGSSDNFKITATSTTSANSYFNPIYALDDKADIGEASNKFFWSTNTIDTNQSLTIELIKPQVITYMDLIMQPGMDVNTRRINSMNCDVEYENGIVYTYLIENNYRQHNVINQLQEVNLYIESSNLDIAKMYNYEATDNVKVLIDNIWHNCIINKEKEYIIIFDEDKTYNMASISFVEEFKRVRILAKYDINNRRVVYYDTTWKEVILEDNLITGPMILFDVFNQIMIDKGLILTNKGLSLEDNVEYCLDYLDPQFAGSLNGVLKEKGLMRLPSLGRVYYSTTVIPCTHQFWNNFSVNSHIGYDTMTVTKREERRIQLMYAFDVGGLYKDIRADNEAYVRMWNRNKITYPCKPGKTQWSQLQMVCEDK